jgi:hypothetical protein
MQKAKQSFSLNHFWSFIMARSKSLISLTSYIKDRKEELRAQRERLNKIEANKGWFTTGAKVCEEVAKVAKQYNAIEYMNAYPHVGYSWLDLDVDFVVPCESLTEGVVPAVLEAALAAGFDATETADRVNEYTAARVYRFFQSIGPLRVTLAVRAEVKNTEGATCRKVQIGTVIEEVPKYQLVCN